MKMVTWSHDRSLSVIGMTIGAYMLGPWIIINVSKKVLRLEEKQ